MTREYFEPEPRLKVWFRKEQGRFLKKARIRAKLSVKDVLRKTGVDIRWVESGEVNLQMNNLLFLVQLYGVPIDYFATWEAYIGTKVRQMNSKRPIRPFH